MITHALFLSRSYSRVTRDMMAGSHIAWCAGWLVSWENVASKPCVSRLASSTTYRPYQLHSSYLF